MTPDINIGPKTSGGTLIVQPNVVPAGEYFWGTGAFDDFAPVAPKTGRGQGAQITMETGGSAGDVAVISGRFFEYVYIIGGAVYASGGDVDDHLSSELFAPVSTPVVDAVTGNVVAVPTGAGFNLWAPVTEGQGTHRVDGDVFEFGQINQDLCPVPATEDEDGNGTGFWDWDPALAPAATLVPNAQQTGRYNLFDQELSLGRQANRYPVMVGYQRVTPEASIKAKKILPHWRWEFTLVRGGSGGSVKLAIRLDTARTKTS